MAAGAGTCIVYLRRPAAAQIALGTLRIRVAIRPGASGHLRDERPAARARPLRPVSWATTPGARGRPDRRVVFVPMGMATAHRPGAGAPPARPRPGAP